MKIDAKNIPFPIYEYVHVVNILNYIVLSSGKFPMTTISVRMSNMILANNNHSAFFVSTD